MAQTPQEAAGRGVDWLRSEPPPAVSDAGYPLLVDPDALGRDLLRSVLAAEQRE
jgi:hypothetical protein